MRRTRTMIFYDGRSYFCLQHNFEKTNDERLQGCGINLSPKSQILIGWVSRGGAIRTSHLEEALCGDDPS